MIYVAYLIGYETKWGDSTSNIFSDKYFKWI